MKSTQLAGNDEQFASALALAANRLGVPARVVVGATPDASGVVKGKDVHAWVEVRTTAGAWQAILPTQFLPDRNKKPQPLIQKSDEKKTGAQVPPPAANNPPSVLQGPDQAQNATQLKNPPKEEKSPLDPSTWPDWLRYLLFFVVGPALVLLLAYGAIRCAKWLRRRRRRSTGAPATQVTGGWREVVDTARDLRLPLPVRGTRLEQARALEDHVFGPEPQRPSRVVDGALMGVPARVATLVPDERGSLALVPLATTANGHVFDIDQPTPGEVDAFWADVVTARKAIRSEQGFWQRVRGDVSLRTFRDHLPTGAGLGPAKRRTSRGQGVSGRRGEATSTRRGGSTKAGIGTSAPSSTSRLGGIRAAAKTAKTANDKRTTNTKGHA